MQRRTRELERKREAMEAQIKALRDAYRAEESEIAEVLADEGRREKQIRTEQRAMARSRKSNESDKPTNGEGQSPSRTGLRTKPRMEARS
jgi:hypothetical protein